MAITSEKIKELRDKTDVSIMACKKALEKAEGDMEKAALFLRKEGAKVAEKKSDRALNAGTVEAYVHSNRQVGVLVEARCETDFVGKNEMFLDFAHNIALHIAAADPLYVSLDDVSEESKEEIKRIFEEEISKIDKPQDIKEKILEGKMDTYLKERVLLEQDYVKNPDITIGDYIKEVIQKFGENIEITRFKRFSIS
ncbi:MAG: elongation factor Ts [bacterium]|nr:elongation factor Ts [bacterium]